MIFKTQTDASAAALLGLSFVLAPAIAGATTCDTVSACVFATNTGRGNAVAGTGRSNYGVYGTSSANSGVVGSTTHEATSAAVGKSGVSGFDSSTNKLGFNSGVYGFSAYGNGVHAKSTSGNGLYGETSAAFGGSGVAGSAPNGFGVSAYGAVGIQASTPPDEDEGYGYVGLSADSFAVEGTGVEASGGEYGITASLDATRNILPGAALYANGFGLAPGILADTEVLDTSSSEDDSLDILTSGFGSGLGIYGSSGTPLTLFATGKTLMTASNSSKDVMSLDSSGNLILAGKLTQKGSPAIVSQRADGTSVLTYGSRSADPTIEDVGEASVVNGVATVPLDPSFAGTMNFAHPYFVFLTPEGDNAGLYVAAKTARGFVVNEARGAHSTLRVQYRIVASPLDDRATPRLQGVSASLLAASARSADKFQRLRERDNVARQRFAKLKKDRAARVAHR